MHNPRIPVGVPIPEEAFRQGRQRFYHTLTPFVERQLRLPKLRRLEQYGRLTLFCPANQFIPSSLLIVSKLPQKSRIHRSCSPLSHIDATIGPAIIPGGPVPKKKSKKKAKAKTSQSAWSKLQQLGGFWTTVAVVIPAFITGYFEIRNQQIDLEHRQAELNVQRAELETRTEEIDKETQTISEAAASLEEESQRATDSVQSNVLTMREWLSNEFDKVHLRIDTIEERITELEAREGIEHLGDIPIYTEIIPEPVVTRVAAMGIPVDIEAVKAHSAKKPTGPPDLQFYEQRDVFPEEAAPVPFAEDEALKEKKKRVRKPSVWETPSSIP
jgi:hypothetical protein